MTDTITVRDHSQPCEHPQAYRALDNDTDKKVSWWWCYECPGGREIVLRRAAIAPPVTVVHPDYTVRDDWGYVWVEVDDAS